MKQQSLYHLQSIELISDQVYKHHQQEQLTRNEIFIKLFLILSRCKPSIGVVVCAFDGSTDWRQEGTDSSN